MTEDIKFSLIVPVYNVAQYLRRCLDSIAAQDYHNYEVICVNDGSTDNSPAILAEYGTDNRFTIIHQENKGLGGARNTGLAHSCGHYVWCIDSDDWIASDSLSRIHAAIKSREKTGVVMVDMTKIYEDGSKSTLCVTRDFNPDELLTCWSLTRHLLLYEGLYAAQARIFRADIIKGFRFSDGFYEDIPLITLFAKQDFPIVHLRGEVYYYFQRSGSIMKTVDRRILDVFRQFRLVNDYLQDDSRYTALRAHFFYYLSAITYEKCLQSGDPSLQAEARRLFREGKRGQASLWQVLRKTDITLRRKLKLVYYYFKMS